MTLSGLTPSLIYELVPLALIYYGKPGGSGRQCSVELLLKTFVGCALVTWEAGCKVTTEISIIVQKDAFHKQFSLDTPSRRRHGLGGCNNNDEWFVVFFNFHHLVIGGAAFE